MGSSALYTDIGERVRLADELRYPEIGWDQSEQILAFVVGVPDAAKGEALVLLTVHPVTPEELRTKLAAAGPR